MKLKSILTFVFLFYSLIGHSQTAKYSNKINQAANKLESKVIDWRHDIHEHPELGNREFRTAALIAKHLKALGMEVKTNVGVTGVVAILKGGKPGPVIALRADMDALPVLENTNLSFTSKEKSMYNGKETPVMHACGHDGHVAILMGVAEILASMKNELKGTVKFIFQPAEEGAPIGEEGGAELMIKEGVLENPNVDVIFGLHLDAQTEIGNINYRPGGAMAASADFKITVNGKGSHGAAPWSSVDPILVSAQIINSLQTIVSRNVEITENPVVVTVGTINGGNRNNIISDKVEMIGTVRTFSDFDRDLVYKRIHQIAEKTAEAAGATALVEIPFSGSNPVTFNDFKLTAQMLPTFESIVGKEHVMLVPAITGAEDFSYFQEKIPGLYFFIGGMSIGADAKNSGPHHTSKFIIDDAAFKTGMVAFCNLVFDYGENFQAKK